MNFPDEIIIDILLRLPAKSILRFKCVSKLWYQLINGSHFINLHLERSLAKQTNLHFIIKSPILHLVDFDTFNNPIELNYPFKNPNDGGVGVVGSCNGLLCLQSYNFQHPLLIYNPTTQTYKRIPVLPIRWPFNYTSSIFNFGFGYDGVSMDYKCVRVTRDFNNAFGYFETDVAVYSMKDDLWRVAVSPSVPYEFDYHNGRSLFFNGAIHWGGVIKENIARDILPIVAFRLGDETFRTLAIPSVDPVDIIRMFVGVIDGCLSLTVSYMESDSDVWVMKKYGSAGSWTKLFSIAKRNGYEEVEKPICYSINRKKLFVNMAGYLEAAFIDLDNREIRDVKVANFYTCTNTCVCVENLLMLEERERCCGKKQRRIQKGSRNKYKSVA